MRNRTRRTGITLLKIGASVGSIYWVFSNIALKDVMRFFSGSNIYYLGGASVFIVLSFIFSAFRQNLSFQITGADISELLSIKLLWLGQFYNLFLPGGVGGDGIKVYLVNKYRKNGVKKNIDAMLVNRISGLVVICMFTVILYYPSGLSVKNMEVAWVSIPLIYLLYLVLLKLLFRPFLKIHAGLLGWSLALQATQLISALLILFAFHQTTGLYDYLFLFFASAIATAIPITIGGIGSREMLMLVSAKTLGLDYELCVALSFIFFLISAVISLVGLFWVFSSPFRGEPDPDNG